MPITRTYSVTVPSPCLNDIDVVVLAGGLGTRIRDTLGDTPKLLAPIGGHAFLDILIARLRNFGARRLILGLGHLAGKVTAHLENNSPADIDIVTAVEPDGTAVGMVVGSFPSVSLDPPLVAFFPAKSSGSWPRIEKVGRFCVNILASDQLALCRQIAAPGDIIPGIAKLGQGAVEEPDAAAVRHGLHVVPQGISCKP